MQLNVISVHRLNVICNVHICYTVLHFVFFVVFFHFAFFKYKHKIHFVIVQTLKTPTLYIAAYVQIRYFSYLYVFLYMILQVYGYPMHVCI